MRLLPHSLPAQPSMSRPSSALRVYSTTPTPTSTNRIVNTFSAVPKGWTSRKPIVVTVVTVW